MLERLPRVERFEKRLGLPGKIWETGWKLPASVDIEEWATLGRLLAKAEHSMPWLLGDWWCHGVKAYGARKALFDEGGPLEGMNFASIRQYGWVANKIEASRRLDVLSFQHHMEVAHFPADEQREWLTRAEQGDDDGPWSAERLRRAIRHAKRGIKAAEKFNAAQADGLANVIYADPPWQYDNSGFEGAAEDHYPPMSIEEICNMQVIDCVHDHAALFLWVTNPLLFEAGAQVMAAWGFDYKTNFVWDKIEAMNSLGFYNRGQHELLLLGTRGSFVPEGAVRNLPSSVLRLPKSEHSRKPLEFYDLIEALYPRFIPTMRELFCRGLGRVGWLAPFGNEVSDGAR